MASSMSLPPRKDTFFTVFSKHQLRPNPKPPMDHVSVAGKTVVITGGNVGIGLECGRLLLSRGLSRLILGVRSPQKGEEAVLSLRKAYPKATIDIWHLDLNSYDSIRAFSRKCNELTRLDVAIMSAGIMNAEFKVTPSTGHEEQFQVNYLSTALLGLLLLPALRKNNPEGSPGRLTFVASGAALIAEFAERNEDPLFSAFDKSEGWNSSSPKKRYDTSKGLVLMLTHKLSQITKAEDTIVNVADPSFTPGTSFFRSMPWIVRLLAWPLTALIGTSVNNAAWRYIDTAVSRGPASHGSFISDWEVSPYNAFMYTEEGKAFMDKLWKETVAELDFPEVREVLRSLEMKSAA
ncbi:unnamed protein product [Clonostachys byssicola]|uniref:Uncharacterized protein n=1 Tax=Clonostachys byssicola TaxID=160290 RepID=A0A9N9UJQ4_9HYPO|nr:unnamed protein product [Clonostachys byssicola]